MFCCCQRDQSSYVLEEAEAQKAEPQKVEPSAGQANIHTGKGALSSSNQSLPNEASLDKSTISATKREKSPVTEQPIKPAAQSGNNTAPPPSQQPQQPEPKVQSQEQPSQPKPVEVAEIDTQIITASTASENQSTPNRPSSTGGFVSTIKVASNSTPTPTQAASVEQSNSVEISNPVKTETQSEISNLVTSAVESRAIIDPTSASNPLSKALSQLESLEKSVTEVEGRTSYEAKKAVPALTSQLQVVTSEVISIAPACPQIMSDQLAGVVSRLEAVATRLENLASKSGSGGSAGDSGEVAPFVAAFESNILGGPLAQFLSLSNEIGGEVQTQAKIVKEAFDAQRNFLAVVAKSKQPDQVTLMELLKPCGAKIQEAQDYREQNRRSDMFNHLSAVSESIAALGWVTVAPTPAPFVKEMADAGTFYSNRVLKDFRQKDQRHVDWTKAWQAIFTELFSYIKEFHTTGVSWNPKGGDAKSAGAVPPPPAGGAPPPPPPGGPPPPPPPPPPAPANDGEDDNASRNALFAEINKGTDVTKGLRKVTDDMKTHKNPKLRMTAAPFKPATAPKPGSSPKPAPKAAVAVDKPPVFELQGKKWIIEYQKDNKNLVIENTELRQSLYAYKCEGSVIQIKGKINSIVLDSCKKTAIVFDDLVSSLEFVNCQSMQAQVLGKLPTVSIDKTDGCQVYLSDKSLDVEIVSAKSSEMNILVPTVGGDMREFALPEQYKTTYNGETMVTTVADSL